MHLKWRVLLHSWKENWKRRLNFVLQLADVEECLLPKSKNKKLMIDINCISWAWTHKHWQAYCFWVFLFWKLLFFSNFCKIGRVAIDILVKRISFLCACFLFRLVRSHRPKLKLSMNWAIFEMNYFLFGLVFTLARTKRMNACAYLLVYFCVVPFCEH